MNSLQRRIHDEWVTANYETLVQVARRYHSCPTDLVSHVYLRVVKQDFSRVMQNPMGYYTRAMHVEGTMGKFAKLYADPKEHTKEPVAPRPDITLALRREQLQLFIDRLPWFDKQVFVLWLQGWNISQVARESGINQATLHTSLNRTKKKITNAFSQLSSAKR